MQSTIFQLGNHESGAAISDCGLYRYQLWRAWDDGLPAVNFLMLNPSTADASEDDPTIKRCLGFARCWGFGRLDVTNLYAYRATDPTRLKAVADPVGPINDQYLRAVAVESALVVCAWGANADPDRAAEVLDMLAACDGKMRHLGLTKAGQPRHPLYLPARLTPQLWR